MTAALASRRRLAYFAWAAVCLIWGTTYLGIRISLESIPPALMGGLRWTVAGSLLALYLVARGRPLPPPSQWRGLALPGFLLGLRFGVMSAWLALVVVEQLNATSGVGYMINLARTYAQTDVIVVCLVIYALLGLAVDAIVRGLERTLLAWRPAFTGA